MPGILSFCLKNLKNQDSEFSLLIILILIPELQYLATVFQQN